MSPAKVQPTATNADSMEELDEKSYVGVGRVSIIYDLDDNIMEYGAKGKGRFSCAWFKDMLPLATIAGLSTVAIYVPTIIYDSDAWLVTDTVVRGTALSHILMIPPSVIMLMWCVSPRKWSDSVAASGHTLAVTACAQPNVPIQLDCTS